ncbi:MATE family efflux transporter [Spirochaetia bacterium]|nr:MATE family efflux transporter [Spirochaetia bacterium]
MRIGPLSFYRKALSLALPVMLQMLIMGLVSLIDNFMVAGLGDASMAAVNVSNQLNFIFMVFVNCVCGAGAIYMAQFNGANDPSGMKNAYRFKVLLVYVLFIVYFTLCQTIPERMLSMMTYGNSEQSGIVNLGSQYLRLAAWTLLPMGLSIALGSSFREVGRPRIPLIISAIATLINTAGNWLLIYGNLGAPRLEVRGAAIATIIARTCEVLMFVIFARIDKTKFFVPFIKIFNVDKKLIKDILSKSAMILVSEASWITGETLMMAICNRRGGAETVAGMAAGFTIANLFYLCFAGVWTVTSVTVGGSLGAGKLKEAKQRAAWIQSGSIFLGIMISVVGAAGATALVPLVFSNLTIAARHICMSLVYVVAVFLPLWDLLNAQFAISRAGGDAAMGMWADISVTIVIIPLALFLGFATMLPPVAMFAIIKSTDVPKYFIARYFLKKERWIRNMTIRR